MRQSVFKRSKKQKVFYIGSVFGNEKIYRTEASAIEALVLQVKSNLHKIANTEIAASFDNLVKHNMFLTAKFLWNMYQKQIRNTVNNFIVVKKIEYIE